MNHQQITFQVTLPSGAVATNPVELGYYAKASEWFERPIVTDDGRVLHPLPPADLSDAGDRSAE